MARPITTHNIGFARVDPATIGIVLFLTSLFSFWFLAIFSSLGSISYVWDEFAHKINAFDPVTDMTSSRNLEMFPVIRNNLYYQSLFNLSALFRMETASEALNILSFSFSIFFLALTIHCATASRTPAVVAVCAAFTIPSIAFGNASMPDMTFAALATVAVSSTALGLIERRISLALLGFVAAVVAVAVKPHGLFLYVALYTSCAIGFAVARFLRYSEYTRFTSNVLILCNPASYYICIFLIEWMVQQRMSLIPTFIFSEFYSRHIAVRDVAPDFIFLAFYFLHNYISFIISLIGYFLPLIVAWVLFVEAATKRLSLLIVFFMVLVAIYVIPMSLFSTMEVANGSSGIPPGRLHHRYIMFAFASLAALLSAAVAFGSMAAPVRGPSRRRYILVGIGASMIVLSSFYVLAVSSAYPNDSPELFGILRASWKVPTTIQGLFPFLDPFKAGLYMSALGLSFLPISRLRVMILPIMATLSLLGQAQNFEWQRGMYTATEDLILSADLGRIEMGRPKSRQEWLRDDDTIIVGTSLHATDLVFLNAFSCDCRYQQIGTKEPVNLQELFKRYARVVVIGESEATSVAGGKRLGPRVRMFQR